MTVNSVNSSKNGYDCAICLDKETNSPLKQICPSNGANGGHSFHTYCFAKRTYNLRASCPECKTDLTSIIAESADPQLQLVKDFMAGGIFFTPLQDNVDIIKSKLPDTPKIKKMQEKYKQKSLPEIANKLVNFCDDNRKIYGSIQIVAAKIVGKSEALNHEVAVAALEYWSRGGNPHKVNNDCIVM